MKPPKLQPALLGGLFIGVLSALPFVNVANCCCLWLVTGGLLAAYVMQQNHRWPVSLGDGAAVGFVAGLIGFGVMLVASFPIEMIAGPYTRGLSQGMFGRPNNVSPEVRDMLQSVPPALVAAIGGAIFLVVGSLASTVGGIIGAALFRRSLPPVPPDAPMPAGWAGPPGGVTPDLPPLPPNPPPDPPVVDAVIVDEPVPREPGSNEASS
jgi:hypothetical protein